MNKCLKNRGLIIISSAGGVLLLLFAGIWHYGAMSKASNEIIATGEAISTINEYEKEGITTYIGYGYNVVKKDYINADDVSKTNTIFNITDKDGEVKGIRNTSVIVDNASNKTDSYYINARSVESFMTEFNNKITAKANLVDTGKWVPFSSGVMAEASSSLSNKSTTQKKSEYVKDIREVKIGTAIWELDECEYYDYLTSEFKKDILEMDAYKLFDKYGTHFLRSVVLGGRLELNAKVEADSNENLTKVVNSFKMTMDSLSTNEEGKKEKDGDNTEVQNDMDLTVQNILKNGNIEISSTCYGGEAQDFTSYINTTIRGVFSAEDVLDSEALIGNQSYGSTYANWLNTVSERPALVDIYDSDSLYPIWELLNFFIENDYSLDEEKVVKRKRELEEAFTRYGEENYNKLIGKYNIDTPDSVYATMNTTLTGIKDGKSYNKKYLLNESELAIHDEFDMGDVLITNTAEVDEDEFANSSDKLQVIYQLQQDTSNLPFKGDYLWHKLNSDASYLSSIYGYGDVINKWNVGKGAYYVQVFYKDQVTTSVYGNNMLKKMNNGDSVVLLETDPAEVDKHGGIDKIKVLILYQTKALEVVNATAQPRVYNWMVEGTAKFK